MNNEKILPLVPYTNEVYDRCVRARKLILSLSTTTIFKLMFDENPIYRYTRLSVQWQYIQNKVYYSMTDINSQRRLQSVNSLTAAFKYWWLKTQKIFLDYKKSIKYKLLPIKEIEIPEYKFNKGEREYERHNQNRETRKPSYC